MYILHSWHRRDPPATGGPGDLSKCSSSLAQELDSGQDVLANRHLINLRPLSRSRALHGRLLARLLLLSRQRLERADEKVVLGVA